MGKVSREGRSGEEGNAGKRGSEKRREIMADEANPPKRPPSAYLIFMSDFREEYKVKNPEGFKKVTEVAKAGAAKWATMGPAAKKPYEDQAAVRKAGYPTAKEEYLKT